jgi:two-component system LytT family response regulator
MRAIVVDDEVHARRSLAGLLGGTGQLEVVATCANAVEALRAIKAEQPDVLFLDIQLPRVNGFQLLSMIDPEIMPSVVFVTAFDEFAVKAFEESAVDYLLKPVQRERLARTVEKLRRSSSEGRRPVYDSPAIERIPCAGPSCIRLVDVADVEQVRCNDAGVYLITSKGEFLTDLTLQVLESKTELARCHRQCLVNVRQIEEIRRPAPRTAVLRMRSGREVPVSRRYFVKLKQRLGLTRDTRYLDPLA